MDLDWRLRLAAFAALDRLCRQGDGVVSGGQLADGFEFEGERIRLFDVRRGIWRPRQLGRDGAALTIVTTPPKPGKKPPYDDQIASDDKSFLYRYEGTDPHYWTNVAIRTAMHEQRPLIYLYGVVPNLYEPIFPCYVIGDDPVALGFRIVADAATARIGPDVSMESELTAPRREYATAAVKVRLHQRRFRSLVLSAYRNRCTICRLTHSVLLDAAHILPDRDERGRPDVSNGLSLCKIHHAAYDANIMGVDPACVVHVRQEVLDEHDGPMLRHGLQEMQGTRILLPRSAVQRPRQEYLEERYERFRAA
ncbi:MAG: HNH endonuclease [Gemmatimonadales bacterium]